VSGEEPRKDVALAAHRCRVANFAKAANRYFLDSQTHNATFRYGATLNG
jgi:hypothetical protein